jgi:hypothetical protein
MLHEVASLTTITTVLTYQMFDIDHVDAQTFAFWALKRWAIFFKHDLSVARLSGGLCEVCGEDLLKMGDR